MAVRIVFLGRLADLAGVSARELPGPLDWSGLIAALAGPLGDTAAGDKTKVALNGVVLSDNNSLSATDGDEVALLPPVSGG